MSAAVVEDGRLRTDEAIAQGTLRRARQVRALEGGAVAWDDGGHADRYRGPAANAKNAERAEDSAPAEVGFLVTDIYNFPS
jgi:hypothetical protein